MRPSAHSTRDDSSCAARATHSFTNTFHRESCGLRGLSSRIGKRCVETYAPTSNKTHEWLILPIHSLAQGIVIHS